MPVLSEGQHAGEFLVSEANGSRSRETITVVSGQNLQAGHVLGKVTVGTTTGAAVSGNTGNGTISGVSAGTGAKPGVYSVNCIEPASNSGAFLVEDPDGVTIGHANVGAAFTGAVNFTLNDGSTDFSAGDRFAITIAEGTDKYKEYNPANTDGSQIAVALLFDNVDATDADQTAVAIVRQAEFNQAEIVWFDGATTNQMATGLDQLTHQTLIAR